MARVTTSWLFATSTLLKLSSCLPTAATPTAVQSSDQLKVLDVPLDHDGSQYSVNITLGTSRQIYDLTVDTGSPSTWIDANVFDPASSSTFVEISQTGLDVGYGDKSHKTGGLFADDIGIGSAVVENMTIGLATGGTRMLGKTRKAGLLGLSPVVGLEADISSKGLLENLVEQGIVGTRSLALWLDHDHLDSTANMIIGGYDRSKYEGDLTVFAFTAASELPHTLPTHGIPAYVLTATGLEFETPDGTRQSLVPTDFHAIALLDSGSQVTILPAHVFEAIVAALQPFGLYMYKGMYLAPCSSIPNQPGGIDLQFSHARGSQAPNYRINYRDLFSVVEEAYNSPKFENSGLCKLMLRGDGIDGLLLGQQFLRSVYTVTNLDERTIGLAQAVESSDSRKDVREIKPNDPFWRLQ